jgi:DNA-binding GntR family transcriptional regulator
MSKMKNTPIFKASFVDQVYEYLLDKIITNEISYGDNLKIKDLSETLGISTMPIREAIKRLEYERLVEVKPRSNCQVRYPDKQEITSIYELREALELFAIRKFLKSYDPSRLEELETITKDMRKVAGIKEPSVRARKAMELDRKFHLELCRLADNEFLNLYHRQLSIHLNMAAIHAKTYQQLEDKYFESHSTIVKSLKEDPDKSLQNLEKHFDNVWAVLGQT